jgi:hypothetical protein
MRTILIIAILCITALAEEYEGNIKSVVVTDSSVFIVTVHEGTMYNQNIKYIGDYYVVKNKKLDKATYTADVVPEVKIKEQLIWKKDKKK